MNKRIPIIALIAFTTTFTVGCKKKETTENQTPTQTQTEIKEEKVPVKHIEKVSFKNLNELKSFSKKNTSDFGKFLTSNKIDNIVSSDGSISINKNMTYEKYTKNFNQLAYTSIETDFKNGTGYLKTGIKVNFHLEEILDTKNNFAKAIYTIVNKHNPEITEEEFNKQLHIATSNPTTTSDYQFDLGINGMSLNVYTKPEKNERELVLSIRQELEFLKSEEIIKEYKTVKEFKEDSEKLTVSIQDKIEELNKTLKNKYVGKCDNIKLDLKSVEINASESFSQSIELEYKAENINDSIPEEVITGLYENIESILTKEKLSKVLSLEDFKEHLKSLEIYSGLHTSDNLVNEIGEQITPNSLPLFEGIIDLSVGFERIDNNETESLKEETTDNNIKKYNTYIKLKVNVPIKAEGITRL